MINILYTARSSNLGGSERSILLLIDHLGNKIKPVVIIPGKGTFFDELEKRGVTYYILNNRSKLNIIYLARLLKIIIKEKIQLLHHHSSRFDCIPAKLWGIKTVERLNIPRNREGLFVNKFILLDRLTASLVNKIICPSEYIKNQARERGIDNKKLLVIYNGIDTAVYRPNNHTQKNKELVIGVFGRLEKIKGHRILLKALSKIKKNIDPFKLIIVGDGEEKEILKKAAVKLNIEDHVSLLGYQSKIIEFYNQCDIIVIPSINDALPNVLIEAMSMAKPIIASNVGGLKEIIKNNETGVLFRQGDEDELSKAILKVARDKYFRKKIANNAYNQSKKLFSMSFMIEQTLYVYKKLI